MMMGMNLCPAATLLSGKAKPYSSICVILFLLDLPDVFCFFFL